MFNRSNFPEKTPVQGAVERFIAGAIGATIDQASAAHPCPPLSEPGETPTAATAAKQIAKRLEAGETGGAAHLCLVLACWLARTLGIEMSEALKLAGIAWAQSAGLPLK